MERSYNLYVELSFTDTTDTALLKVTRFVRGWKREIFVDTIYAALSRAEVAYILLYLTCKLLLTAEATLALKLDHFELLAILKMLSQICMRSALKFEDFVILSKFKFALQHKDDLLFSHKLALVVNLMRR